MNEFSGRWIVKQKYLPPNYTIIDQLITPFLVAGGRSN